MTHMRKYNVAQAKAHFSELMQRALDGEEVVIARDNKPLLRLVPVRTQSGRRKPGSGRGQLLHMADDFNAPLRELGDYTK
jgi:prevent-host-death family protein